MYSRNNSVHKFSLSFEVSFMLKAWGKEIELAFDKNSKLTDFSVYPVIDFKINVT